MRTGPADLVGALQDVVHTDPGPVRAGKSHRDAPSGDFDTDLVHLDSVRKTMADMKRYGSLQGIPMQEAEFLLSFIDNLWREYSRSQK